MSIADFYADRCVLVTGSTGFLGKVLVEKLLRSCPGIRRVYLLIRSKRGVDNVQRLQELVDSPVFEHLRKERPDALRKLALIGGDVSLPDLGVTEADAELLRSQVSLVFHSAARVKFDRDLKEAVDVNVRGTQRVMQLCRQLPHLKAVVHVSTCYVHPDKAELDEIVYPAPVDPRKLLEDIDNADALRMEQLVQQMEARNTCPNVYGGTKAVTEQLLAEDWTDLPLVIVRPSIVTAAVCEPVAGWIENLYGPTGCVAGVGKGFLRAFRFNPAMIGDLVPVDYPVSLIVAAAWRKATRPSGVVDVYNCATGELNPLTWGQFSQLTMESIFKFPIQQMIWYPSASFKSSYFFNQVDIALYHHLPAFFVDYCSRLSGKQPKMGPMYKRAHRLLSCIDYYSASQWRFRTGKTAALMSAMSDSDRLTFDLDVRRIHWPSYIDTFVLGVRQFVHKEAPSTLPAARRTQNKYFIVRFVVHVLLLALVYLFLSLAFRQSTADDWPIAAPIQDVYSPLIALQSP